MVKRSDNGKILEEIAFAASAMARGDNWRDGIDGLLERLGKSVDVSRVYLFELDPLDDGPLSHSCRHDWAAPGLERLGGTDRYTREPLEGVDAATDDWVARRRRNEMIAGHTRDLTGELRVDFEFQSIKSFVSIPIQIKGQWWGHLGFDDCVREREWGTHEIHLLQTTAALIAASVSRQHAEHASRTNETLRAAMLDVALDAIVMTDQTGLIIEFNPAAEAVFGWSRDEILGEPLATRLIPPHLRSEHHAGFERALLKRQMHHPGRRAEMTALRADGHEFPIELTVTKIERGESIVFAASIRDITQRRLAEKRLLEVERERSNLARFFSPQMVDVLVQVETPLSTVKSLPVAILFVDMIGFTQFCAMHYPDQVISMLRELMTLLSDAVFAHGGTVDKFLGDGLLGAFGAPLTGEGDATRAATCAIDILAAVETWNTARANRGDVPVEVAIGLHFGQVIFGDIGTKDRLELTILGDTVNIASRVEGFCRTARAPLLATGDLVDQVRKEGSFALADRFIDRGWHVLRGRTNPTHIFALAGRSHDHGPGTAP